jgi:hypothetical protein
MSNAPRIDLSPEEFVRMRDALSTLRDETAEYIQPYLSRAAPGSRADIEAKECARPESAHTLRGQAFILVEVSADQLTALVKTVTEPVETIAPWTCTRSLLEATALGCWLLDPHINLRSRISRSLALRYEGIDQQAKWARAAGHDASLATAQLNEVDRVARELGYEAVIDARGRRRGAGEAMPSVTDIVKTTVGEESLYRLLSAVAHGHAWALQQLSFAPARDSALADSSTSVRLHGVEKAPNVTGFAYLVLAAAKTFARLAWYQTLYLGWDVKPLTRILESKFDQLNAADHLRCWRDLPV